jgi:UDP-N-acetylmuramoyl-tripeptide--D-alanyl-D-alanine ligase
MTAPLWTSDAIAAATGGRATADFAVTGVSIDTRTLVPGDLFVALKDARDGHDFVAAALAAGAAGALVSRRPVGVAADAPLLVVPDVLAGLTALGAAGRARSAARVVGVTGSVGKTSTKEMLRAVLGHMGRTHAAEASYNNHWGVPLTLARMPPDSEFAVIEIGMNHPGEIAPLARLSRLHVALITTVAAAHLEAFGSVEGIAREKAAIFDGLAGDGVAIIPSGLETSPILLDRANGFARRVLTFGRSAGDDYRMTDVKATASTTVVRAERFGHPVLFKVRSPGAHFAMNALGVLAVAEALGGNPVVAACDIGEWQPPEGRGRRERILLDRIDEHLSFELIDDAFNANPASMAAALDMLAASEPAAGIGRIAEGRRIAVLADMLELGPGEQALHVAIAQHPALAKVHLVHCVGPRMHHLWRALPDRQRGEWHESATALAERASHLVDAGDVILVKGSKGSKVSLVVSALRRCDVSDRRETKGSV